MRDHNNAMDAPPLIVAVVSVCYILALSVGAALCILLVIGIESSEGISLGRIIFSIVGPMVFIGMAATYIGMMLSAKSPLRAARFKFGHFLIATTALGLVVALLTWDVIRRGSTQSMFAALIAIPLAWVSLQLTLGVWRDLARLRGTR